MVFHAVEVLGEIAVAEVREINSITASAFGRVFKPDSLIIPNTASAPSGEETH